MEIYDAVKKLIGNIEPIGETNIDDERYQNLESHIDVLYGLLADIADVAKYKDMQEFSMSFAGKKAAYFLKTLPDEIMYCPAQEETP